MISWPHAEPVPQLETNGVHVWAWDLDCPPLDSDWSVLSNEETLRARRFVYPVDRDRYVRAHATMRTLLGGYLGIEAARINFSTLAYGKPQLEPAPDAPSFHFNLTHSNNIAALAISRDYLLGIDVERIRPIDSDIAEHHFSAHELLILGGLPASLWLAAFYRCWTSKEALLKGEGMGLNLPLDGFDVEVHPDRPAALLGVTPPTNISLAWSLIELQPADGFAGTLAVHDPAKTFRRTSLQCYFLSR